MPIGECLLACSFFENDGIWQVPKWDKNEWMAW
jgi:hypothetical protein